MLKQSYQKLWRVAGRVWANRTTGVGEVSAKEYHRIHKRMGRRKGGKNGDEKNDEEGEQDCNSEESTLQKSEEISAQQTHCFTPLRGLSHSLVPLHHHISRLLCHHHVAQPFPLNCLCFSSMSLSITQWFVGEDHHWLLAITFTPKFLSSPSELRDLNVCLSLSRHTGPVPPQEIPCPRAD